VDSSESAVEDRMSSEHGQRRRSPQKAADVVQDVHCSEESKQLLTECSNRLDVDDDDIILSNESHDSSNETGYVAKRLPSPSPPDNHDIGRRPCTKSSQMSHIIHDTAKQQECLFKTARCNISVFVYTGDLLQEKVDAIVNPANVNLIHGGGAAKAIAKAAGPQLQDVCAEYIRQSGPLKVTEAMHTLAGNLSPNVRYVIHAASCNARDYQDHTKLHVDLRATFYNCLKHANDVLKIQSMAIPAIGAGW